MNKESIFEAALAMNSPWYIDTIKFDDEQKRLDIFINFERVSRSESKNPEYPGEFKACDTKQKQWRHLNFFEHECYSHCRVPRIRPAENKTELISPPWEGRCPGLTLLFEALALELATHMPVLAVSEVIGETDDKIWRMLNKYVDVARTHEDFSKVVSTGMDETSRAKRHDYISLFVDSDKRRTIFVTEGKDHSTVDRFANDLRLHLYVRNGNMEKIDINPPAGIEPDFHKKVGVVLASPTDIRGIGVKMSPEHLAAIRGHGFSAFVPPRVNNTVNRVDDRRNIQPVDGGIARRIASRRVPFSWKTIFIVFIHAGLSIFIPLPDVSSGCADHTTLTHYGARIVMI